MNMDDPNMDDRMKTPDKSREQEIDRWLDDALSQYSKVDPRDGLEGRVLARLAEARREPTRKLHWWGALAFTTAAILAIALLWHAHTESMQFRETPAAKVVAPAATESRADNQQNLDASVLAKRTSVNHTSNNRPLTVAQHKANRGIPANTMQQAAPPKLEQFPSTHHLSQEEWSLVRYLNEQSDKEALLKATATPSEVDLSIDSLEIRPLEIPDIEISESQTN
jgi:hypothetical protein